MTRNTRQKHINYLVNMIMTIAVVSALPAFAQSESAYDVAGAFGGGSSSLGSGNSPAAPSTSLLDPSRFSIAHSMSFMAGGSQIADVKSQSVYSTLFQYKFDAPVVFRLNFDMPIHSTFNRYNNFTQDNLSSLEYFKNMPIDASIMWMPTEKIMLGFRVIKQPESMSSFYYGDRFFRGW